MNRMNRKVEYALMALKHMSSKFAGTLTTVKEICDVTGAPFDATARVMQTMAHQGIMKSEQGARGGYILIKDLSKVSFLQLLEMILGPVGIAKCSNGAKDCELLGSCNMISPIHTLNIKVTEFYGTLSLQEVLHPREREPRPSVIATAAKAAADTKREVEL